MSPLLQQEAFFKLLEKKNIWGKRTSSSARRVARRTVASIIRNVGMEEASARKGRDNERDTGLTATFEFSRREESLLTRAAEEVETKIPTYSSAKGFQMLGCVVERPLRPQGQGQQSPAGVL